MGDQMASNNACDLTFTAGGAISQFAAVEFASGKVTATDAVGDTVFGIAQESADADGDEITVRVQGVSQCLVDGTGTAIAVGDDLMPEGSGSGKLTAHSGTTGDTFAARALEASTADGDIIQVLLYDRQVQSA